MFTLIDHGRTPEYARRLFPSSFPSIRETVYGASRYTSTVMSVPTQLCSGV